MAISEFIADIFLLITIKNAIPMYICFVGAPGKQTAVILSGENI